MPPPRDSALGRALKRADIRWSALILGSGIALAVLLQRRFEFKPLFAIVGVAALLWFLLHVIERRLRIEGVESLQRALMKRVTRDGATS